MQPRWLTWLFILALGYMVYASGESHRAAQRQAPVSAQAPTPDKPDATLAEFTDVEAWKRKINPEYAASHNCDAPGSGETIALKIIEDAAGEGVGAVCGETIALTLTLWDAAGKPSSHHTLDLPLGAQALASGLDAGLLGIKPKGVRTLVLGPAALKRAKKSPLPAGLLEAMPNNRVVVVTVERVK